MLRVSTHSVKFLLELVLVLAFFIIPSAYAAPDAVTNLSALTGPSAGSMFLQWTYPGPEILPNSSIYFIQYSSWTNQEDVVWSTTNAQVAISTTSTAPGLTRTKICYGLGDGVTSYFRIWITSGSTGGVSEISEGTTNYAKPFVFDATPNSVTSLVIVSTGMASVLLSWTSVDDIDVLGYSVYRSSSPTTIGYSYVSSVISPVSYYYDTGLDPTVTYFYVVRSSDTSQQSSSLHFNTTAYVSLGQHQAFNMSKSVSVSFWVNPTGANNQYLIWKREYGTSWKIFIYETAQNIEFSGPNRTPGCQTSGNYLTAGQWHHVAAVYDYVSRNMKIYIDGTVRGSNSSCGTIGADVNGAIEFSNSTTESVRQRGMLDEVAIYNRALSADEVDAIRASNNTPTYGMVGQWKLNGTDQADNSAPDTLDINNATVSDTPYFWTYGMNGSSSSIVPDTVEDITPPAAISNLTGLPGLRSGSVSLMWSSPGDDENSGALEGQFEIKYTSMSQITGANYETPPSPSYTVNITTSVEPFETCYHTVSSLAPGATYWFAIKTSDEKNWSVWISSGDNDEINTLAYSYATPLDLEAPDSISNLTALPGTSNGSVSLMWTSPGNNGSAGTLNGQFEIKYTSISQITNTNYETPPSPSYTLNISTSVDPLTFCNSAIGNLVPGATYWFAMKADDGENWSVWKSSGDDPEVNTLAWSYAQTVDIIPPAAISNLTALAGTADGTISLRWVSPGNDELSGDLEGQFEIKYSTVSQITNINYDTPPSPTYTINIATAVAALTFCNYTISSLTAGTSYWFAIKAFDATNWSVWKSSGDDSSVNRQARSYAYMTQPILWMADFSPTGITKWLKGQGAGTASMSSYRRMALFSATASNWNAGWYYPNSALVAKVSTTTAKNMNYYVTYIGTGTYDIAFDEFDEGGGYINTLWDVLANPGPANSGSVNLEGLGYHAGAAYFLPKINFHTTATFQSMILATLSFDDGSFIAPPAAVSNLTVTQGPAAGSVALQWTSPGSYGVSGNFFGVFDVKYSSISQVTDANYDNVPSTYVVHIGTAVAPGAYCVYTVSNLTPGASYWFAIKSFNSAEWSVWNSSGEVPAVNTQAYGYALPDIIPPAAISNLTALPGPVNRSVTLRWTAPGNDEMSNTITDGTFRIRYSSHAIITAANFDDAPYSNHTVNITTTVSPGDYCAYTTPATLIPTATYWFAVKAYDGVNWSVWTSSGDVDTVNTLAWSYVPGSSDMTAPAAVTSLSGLVGYNGQINLSWTSPGDNDWTGALQADSQFNIRYATYNAVWTAGSGQVTIGAEGVNAESYQTCQVSGLNPGATYYFRVWTNDGAPNWSEISNGATVYLLEAPTAYIPADASWTNSNLVDWKDYPGALDYLVQIDNDSGFGSVDQEYAPASSSVAFSGLAENTYYWYRVKARKWGDVYTAWSSTKAFRIDMTDSQFTTLEGRKNDGSWVDPSTVYLDTYPVNCSIGVQDTGSGMRAGQTELIPSSGCVMLLRMNEGSGAVAADLSGYGNNGNIVSGVSWDSGRFSGGLDFDGASSSVTVSDSVSLNPENITAGVWIYPTGKDGEQMVMDKRNEGGFNLAVWGGGGTYDLITNIVGPSNEFGYVKSTQTVKANIWQHIAMTYNGSVLKLYYNGELQDSIGVVVNSTGSTLPLLIGYYKGGGLNYQGRMDEITVFNRAMTDEEVAAHYNSGSVKYSGDGGVSWAIETSTDMASVSGSNGTPAIVPTAVTGLALSEAGDNRIIFITQDMAGNVVRSSEYTVLVDTTLPANIAPSAEYGPETGDIRLTWTTPVDTASGLSSGKYIIEYSSNTAEPASFEYSVQFDTNAAQGSWQTYIATGLTTNVYYWFTVQSRDNAGNWSLVSDTIAYRYVYDSEAPAGISNLTALPGSSNRTVTLRWTAPGNDEMSNTITDGTFRVRYSSHAIITAANFDDAPYSNHTVNITTTVSPGDYCAYTTPATLIPTATYWFAVKAYDGANWSVWTSSGDVDTVNTLAWSYVPGSFDMTAPAAVTSLSGLVGYNGQINLSWTSPGDNGWTGALQADSQFNIQYATYNAAWSEGTGQVTIGAEGVNAESYQTCRVSGLSPGATYYFRVWTNDGAPNWSAISNGATVYLAAGPTTYIPADASWTNTAVADWSDVPGALEYQVLFAENSDFSSPLTPVNVAYSSSALSGFAQSTLYGYRVRARLWNDVYTCWSSSKAFRLDYTLPNISGYRQVSTSYLIDAQDTYSGLRVGQAELVPSSGCVLLLHMNEGSGNTLADSSGYGNNGIKESGASWTTGKFTNGLSFNGTSSSATVAHSAELSPANVTVEAWINPAGKTGEQLIVEKRSFGGYAFILLNDAGTSKLQAKIAGPNNDPCLVETSIPNGQWSHAAMTYDGVKLSLYINGETSILLLSSEPVVSARDISGSNVPIKIGSNETWGLFYEGALDDIAVYNRALSAEEIATHFNSGAVKYNTNGGVGDWDIETSLSASSMSGSNGDQLVHTITATGLPFTGNPASDRIRFLVQDMAGNLKISDVYVVTADSVAPSAINNLSVTAKTENSLTLSWASPGDDGGLGTLPSGALFNIQYSTFASVEWSTASAQVSVSAAGTGAGSTATRKVSDLAKDTTYYFRAWTCDERINWSGLSNIATDYTLADAVAPVADAVVIENAGILGQPIVFISTATDSGVITSVKLWYKLFDAAWASAEMTLTDVDGGKRGKYALEGKKVNQEGSIYYYVQAQDNADNIGYWKSESDPQEIKVSRATTFPPTQTGKVTLPNNDTKHGEVSLDIPSGALNAPVTITITQINTNLEKPADDDTVDRTKNSGRPVSVYEFTPSGTKFIKPVTLTLLYFDPDDTGKVQLEDGTVTDIDENTSVLQIFFWDGVQWRLLGGTADKDNNTVSIKINHFSKYAIFPLGSLSTRAAPEEKFVTPHIPAAFGFLAEEVAILDIAGNTVKEMTKTDFGGGAVQWNGFDEEGRFVESGVYIYRIKTTEGKYTYGMIVVAK
ncbi:MAG: LamG-like jellyroll fold domain-containing protein [Elusimicrobiota bacterium]